MWTILFVGASDEVDAYLIAGRERSSVRPREPKKVASRFAAQKTGDLEVTVTRQLTLDDSTQNDPVNLVKLRWPDAAFTYSEDGSQWMDTWEVDRGMPVDDAIDPNSEVRNVFVRLASSDGRSEIIRLASSGRHIAQTAPAAAATGAPLVAPAEAGRALPGGAGGGRGGPGGGRGGGSRRRRRWWSAAAVAAVVSAAVAAGVAAAVVVASVVAAADSAAVAVSLAVAAAAEGEADDVSSFPQGRHCPADGAHHRGDPDADLCHVPEFPDQFENPDQARR